MNKSSSVLINRRANRTIFANIVEQKQAVAEGKQLRVTYITDNTGSILVSTEAGAVETTVVEYQRYIDAPEQAQGPSLPDPPTSFAATSASGEVILTFTPGSDGGAAITNYMYSLDDGTSYSAFSPATGPITGLTISGLTNGRTYSIKLKAVNAIGESTIGSETVYITPLPGSALRLFLDGAFVVDPNGATWPDTSGKGKNATLVNGPVRSMDNSGAYVFDGLNDYATVPSGFADVSAGITVLAFANFGASKDTWERLIDFGTGEQSNNILFSRSGTSSNLIFQIYNGINQPISLSKDLSGGIIENGWGFYVARLDGARYLLKNQNIDVSGDSTVLPAAVTRTSNYIAKSNWADDAFEGRLGVVAIYGSALTDAEIAQFFDLYKTRYFTVPAAPTNLVASPGDGQVSIAFNAGGDGGCAITNYEYSTNGTTYSAFSPADVTSPVVIGGLTNGTSYTIRLRAVNVMGSGAAASVTATPVAPVAPVNLSLPVITGKTLLFRLEGDEPSSYSGSGSTWFDIDGGAGTYNGTLVNTPTYDSSTAGGVFTFNSAQQEYIQIADNAALRANAGASNYKSVVIWIYNTTDTSTGIFSKQSNLNDYDGFSLTFNTNRRLTLNMNGRSVNGNYVTPTTNVYNLNQWTMISAIVCFGGSTSNPSKIYVNTTEVLSQANGEFNVVETNSIQFPAGIQEGNSYSSCSIGAVYYYNGVLTSSDISTLYNATKSRYGL